MMSGVHQGTFCESKADEALYNPAAKGTLRTSVAASMCGRGARGFEQLRGSRRRS